MSKLQYSLNKILKLQNVMIEKIDLEKEKIDLNLIVDKMQSYIKVNGAIQIGPLIQHSKTYMNEKGELMVEVYIFMQCNKFIYNLEKRYRMESVMRIPNCMYCRYVGIEEKLKFAYDKINLEAFENDIELTGESYTVYVEQNEEEGIIVADVFMPKKEEG